ncbi:MAG: hypothetical protein PHP69_05415 [Candidatus Omnitrophica bacterium]|jgi:hypothetical protein|nr:hypothetical protein [Candidatus Omnitrophota bacterium]MDD5080518.1 hypothetical protein [Candidatus Omnitrophota bacterium]
MKVPKKKVEVRIICRDHCVIEGMVYLYEGMRIIDSLNSKDEKFIAVTDAKVSNIENIRSFRLITEMSEKKELLILSKSAVQWMEPITKKRKNEKI